MKGSESFKQAIEAHLQKVAEKDEAFAKKLKNDKKNVDSCVTYILNQVKESGRNGFADEEIYGMAIHYYDEEKVKVGSKIENGSVIVNHQIELSDTEKEEARKEAKALVIAEEKERLRKKPKKKKPEEVKEEPNLFDGL